MIPSNNALSAQVFCSHRPSSLIENQCRRVLADYFLIASVMTASVALPAHVLAGQREATLGYSAAYNSNVNLSEQDRSNAAHLFEGGLVFIETGPRYNADIDLLLGKELNSATDDRLVGEGLAAIEFRVLPKYLNWTVEDALTTTRITFDESVSRDNTDLANTFRTGPDFRFRLSGRNAVEVEGRYERTSFDQREEEDSEVYRSTLNVEHTHSSVTTLGVGYDYSDSYRIDDEQNNVINEEYFIFWNRDPERSSIRLRLGQSQIKGTNDRNETGSFDFGYDLSHSTVVSIAYSLEYTNLIDAFTGRQFIDLEDAYSKVEFYSAGLSWVSFGSTLDFGVYATEQQEVVDSATSDDEGTDSSSLKGLAWGLSRDAGGRMIFNVSLSVSQREERDALLNLDSVVDEWSIGFEASYRMSPALILNSEFSYASTEEEEANGNVITDSFDADGFDVAFGITYNL